MEKIVYNISGPVGQSLKPTRGEVAMPNTKNHRRTTITQSKDRKPRISIRRAGSQMEVQTVSKTSHVDSKGRITIGTEFHGKLYEVTALEGGEVLLVPQQVVPEAEAWLWKNKKALASVKRGIEQAKAGKTKAMSFAKY